jgi:membrane-bound serine protease (ClpP class)
MILPGTGNYLHRAVNEATEKGAKVAVVYLNTPGGMLNTTQDIVSEMFKFKIPVVVYVAPEGATATSAGVFITMAGHVAAMAPGTSIGAAHPVQGNGKDIEGEMAKKATNMTVSMAKSVSEQRNRNTEWVEKAVRESVSITDSEALREKVIDLVAKDLTELLTKIKGKEVIVNGEKFIFEDFSNLPRIEYSPSVQEELLNFFANPTVAAILWLIATTGISIELYNPGLIFPGVLGVVALILALMVTQTIPVNTGGILLLVSGLLMVLAELKFASGILGAVGLVAIILGAFYLVDVSMAPGMEVSMQVFIPLLVLLGSFLVILVFGVARAYKLKINTGKEGLIGAVGEAQTEFINGKGSVFVDGAIWSAKSEEQINKSDPIEVVEVDGLTLKVKRR